MLRISSIFIFLCFTCGHLYGQSPNPENYDFKVKIYRFSQRYKRPENYPFIITKDGMNYSLYTLDRKSIQKNIYYCKTFGGLPETITIYCINGRFLVYPETLRNSRIKTSGVNCDDYIFNPMKCVTHLYDLKKQKEITETRPYSYNHDIPLKLNFGEIIRQLQPEEKEMEPDIKISAAKITPVIDVELGKGSVVYCPTFQLAWDQLKKLAGGDIEMKNAPKLVGELNKTKNIETTIPADAYLAMTGLLGKGIIDKIRSALQTKFNKTLSDLMYVPERDEGIIAFAYLYRKLPFAIKFRRATKNGLYFNFGRQRVPVFFWGFTPKTAEIYMTLIKICHYNNEDDFTLQLRTQLEGETIILAKIPKPKTLREAVELTYDRVRKSKEYHLISMRDAMFVPVVNIDLFRNYKVLNGKIIDNPAFKGQNRIVEAFQKVKFRMDESGATLESSAYDVFAGGGDKARKYVFNKPFLVCLWKTGAKFPYLAVWVDDISVLEKFVPKPKKNSNLSGKNKR